MSACANCKVNEGTLNWGDALAFTHGFSQRWCEGCALDAQIAHAEERAALLPELREQLAAFKASGKDHRYVRAAAVQPPEGDDE